MGAAFNTRRAALLFFLLANCVAADDNAEFAFNLFSDIAPILALFGDQFARQFLSESFTWLDHFIFACVPLGIITALAGAIRVQGPRTARSFIGRARENRATAELELMSSTSQEVCEMFNGQGIVRTMGQPTIAQLIILPDTNLNDPSCGIYTLQDAVNLKKPDEGVMVYELASKIRWLIKILYPPFSSKTTANEEVGTEKIAEKLHSSLDFLGPPNLQLNLSSGQASSRRRTLRLFSAALTALILQLSLLVIAAVTVYHQPTRDRVGPDPQPYGFACYIGGSVILFIGMGICSFVIESSTAEFIWVPCKKNEQAGKETIDKQYPQLIWLQRSQRVSDQTFGSFMFLSGPKHYILTSSRREDVQTCEYNGKDHGRATGAADVVSKVGNKIGTWVATRKPTSDPEVGGNAPTAKSISTHQDETINELTQLYTRYIWEALTVFGVLCGGAGFIAQFIGLRGLPWPCSIAQLGGTFFMALVRALVRREMGKIPFYCHAFHEYELDFLAAQIVFESNFGEFYKSGDGQTGNEYPRGADLKYNLRRWKVRTAKLNASDRFPLPVAVKATSVGYTWSNTAIPDEKSERIGDGSDAAVPDKNATAVAITNLPSSKAIIDQTGLFKSSISGAAAIPKLRAVRLVEKAPRSRSGSMAMHSKGDIRSSERLVHVRERLGDLCRWGNSVSDAARALEESIERFMQTFFSKSNSKATKESMTEAFDSFGWVIETWTFPPKGSFQPPETDHLTITINRPAEEGERWTVKGGRIEAVLSLWIASIEAETMSPLGDRDTASQSGPEARGQAKRGSTDWRRSKAGIGSRVPYCRIIGENFEDGVLKRDISWWVSDQLAEQAHNTKGESERGPFRGGDKVKLVIGFSGPSRLPEGQRGKPDELSLVSAAYLPIILAQHLFTSFMWAIADKLDPDCLRQRDGAASDAVKVNPGEFTLDAFNETWHFPKLSHPRLEGFVRHVEAAGLGSRNDILLCMVPALSFNDLLPNESILSLIPLDPQRFSQYGWARSAGFYYDMLQSSIGVRSREKFTLAVVIHAMEFVYLASEPYSEQVRAQPDLETKLTDLVRCLGTRFFAILEGLLDEYKLQKRHKRFQNVFLLYKDKYRDREDREDSEDGEDKDQDMAGDDSDGAKFFSWDMRKKDEEEEGKEETLRKKPDEVSGKKPREKPVPTKTVEKENAHKSKDAQLGGQTDESEINFKKYLFGWTDLHYIAAAGESSTDLDEVLKNATNKSKPIHRWLDRLGRNPIHIAAICGHRELLIEMWGALSHKDVELASVLETKGLDGMTPLHLAVKGCHEECVKYLLGLLEQCKRSPSEVDAWGRSPIHLAAIMRHPGIARQLLVNDARPDKVDNFGRTPLAYLGDLKRSGTKDSPQQMAEELMGAWKNLDAKDENKKTLLHYAVELLDEDKIRHYLSKDPPVDAADKDGQTPLHLAVLAKREPNIVNLLLESKANRSIKNIGGVTPLMLACRTGQVEVIDIILGDCTNVSTSGGNAKNLPSKISAKVRDVVKDQDNKGQTALHHAIVSDKIPAERLGDVVKKLVDNMKDNIDLKSWTGQTALHTAVLTKKTKIALDLIDSGASSMVPDSEGRVVLHQLARVPDLASADAKELAEALIANAQNRQTAPAQAPSEEVSLSASSGKGLDIPDNSGETPLHAAVAADNDTMALFFVSKGANPGRMNNSGDSPLHVACRRGTCVQFVKLVVRDFSLSASRGTCVQFVKLVVRDFGSELVNRGDEGYDESPIHWACEYGQKETVEVLLAAEKVNPNLQAKDCRLFTPLHFAIDSNNLEIVKLLLDNPRVDPSRGLKNAEDRKPFELAIESGTMECVETIFSNSRTTVQERIEAMEAIHGSNVQYLKPILEHFPPNELPTATVDAIFRRFISVDTKVLEVWMSLARDPERRKQMCRPLHTLARVGHGDFIQELINLRTDTSELDEDGWTFMDVLNKYGYAKLKTISGVPKATSPKEYQAPTEFPTLSSGKSITVEDCNSHLHGSPCSGVKGEQ
ncbi:Ankyrin-1 [Madurella mycetomatis]|uniref:Ankyrin-1 n=1 Tax=Madurella mycetomatis TaxID=100816 RepID=A0A175VXE4_9PEZI|nr:Ankyrin-1 [Madurella mycetomatis]